MAQNRSPRRFPVEICDKIVAHFHYYDAYGRFKQDLATLRNVRMVDRPFYTAASRVLFREVCCVPRWPFYDPLAILEKIAVGELANSVISLHLGLSYSRVSTDTEKYCRTFLGVLSKCLGRFEQLREIKLIDDTKSNNAAVELSEHLLRALNDHTPPRLNTLEMNVLPRRNRLSKLLIPVMPRLQLLDLDYTYCPPGDEAADSSHFSALEHGRNLMGFCIAGIRHDSKACIDAIPSSAPLRSLHLTFMTISLEGIRAICKFAGTLVHLRLVAIELTDGRWADFFRGLDEFPKLLALLAQRCYYSDGEEMNEEDNVALNKALDKIDHRGESMER